MKKKIVIKTDLQTKPKVIRTVNGLIIRKPITSYIVLHTN